jgi:hypothetical protein
MDEQQLDTKTSDSNSKAESKKHQKMMKLGRGMKVRISEGLNFKEGEIRVQSWDKSERVARAFKFGGMCWGAAIVCVLIPLLHFILVPGFLLAGPILAYFVLGQETVVLGGQGTCPHCQSFLPIARAAYQFPHSDLCTHCQHSLEINLIES